MGAPAVQTRSHRRRGPKDRIPDFPREPLRLALSAQVVRLKATLLPLERRRCPRAYCGGLVEIAVELARGGRERLYGECLLCGREQELSMWMRTAEGVAS